ncbi:C2H2-like zinc finger protein, partial [Striga asiatica]
PLPPQPRRNYAADEECAKDALLLLSISGGGLCLRQTPPAKPVYICDQCGAKFSSHQALGGHKTCHRQKPPAAAAKSSGEKPRYVCNICGAVFESGQALGGHQRKHYLEELAAAAASESRQSKSSGSSGDVTIVQETVRRGLDFDLNLPYPFAD